MRRRRVWDGLVGALAALLVLVVAVALLLWFAGEPAGRADPPERPRPADGAPRPVPPPSDLAAGETWLGDLVLDAGAVATPESLLTDVRAVGRDVRAGPGSIVAGSLAVEATVPFEVVAGQLGAGTTVHAAEDGQATVERTVDLAGRRLRVVATGTVEVVAGRLVVEPRSVDIGGPDVLATAIAGVVRRLVTIEHAIEGLPPGLVLQDVTVQDDGFRASLQGEDVRLVS